MSQNTDPQERDRRQKAYNLTMAAVASQVGCLTLIVILAALFGGLWLDSRFGTRPMITIILMIASVPVTLVGMFWVVRAATSRLQQNNGREQDHLQEDTKRGR